MVFPNLIIGGAPKCGTSSVYRWLADHPETLASTPKETFYLLDENNPLLNSRRNYHADGLSEYEAFFQGDKSTSKCVFEATTHYLYSETAREVLASLDPKPDIVFILREPAERIYSSFRYTKNNIAQIAEDVSFSEYARILSGRSSRCLEDVVNAERHLYVARRELQYSRYVEYLTDWFELFGEEKVHPFLFEDLVQNQTAFMSRLAETLGIDAGFYDDYDYERKNATFYVRHKPLHRIARRAGNAIPSGRLKRLLKKAYLAVQTTNSRTGDSKDNQAALSELRQRFIESNRRLAEFAGIDLSSWQSQG